MPTVAAAWRDWAILQEVLANAGWLDLPALFVKLMAALNHAGGCVMIDGDPACHPTQVFRE